MLVTIIVSVCSMRVNLKFKPRFRVDHVLKSTYTDSQSHIHTRSGKKVLIIVVLYNAYYSIVNVSVWYQGASLVICGCIRYIFFLSIHFQ